MSLDKTLFKALRAGGLGHKAALLLADPKNPRSIRPLDPNWAFDDWQSVTVQLGSSVLTQGHGDTVQPGISAPRIITPMTAGSYLLFMHTAKKDMQYIKPDGGMTTVLTKLADANGIPVAPVETYVTHTRSGEVITPAASMNGWTFSWTLNSLRGTQATAGWYLVDTSFYVPAWDN